MAKQSRSGEQPLSDHDACTVLTGLLLEHLNTMDAPRPARKYAKGRNIWTPGEPANSLFFLVKGQVAILVKDRERRETIVRIIDPGEPCGELCYCARGRRSRQDFGRAMATSEVVETPLKQFLEMLRRDKELVQRFVFTLCERLTEADRRVKVLASRDADARLGTLLIQLAGTRGRQSANGGGCVLRVTHTDLAQMAAMSRSHVTVTMGNFRNKHLVEYTRDKPITVNVPALKQYLDSRYPQS